MHRPVAVSKKKLGMKARQVPVALGSMHGLLVSASLISFSSPANNQCGLISQIFTRKSNSNTLFVASGKAGKLVFEQIFRSKTPAVSEFLAGFGLGVVGPAGNDAAASNWARVDGRQQANVNISLDFFLLDVSRNCTRRRRLL